MTEPPANATEPLIEPAAPPAELPPPIDFSGRRDIPVTAATEATADAGDSPPATADAQDMPAQEGPAQETPAEETPTEETPAEEPPALRTAEAICDRLLPVSFADRAFLFVDVADAGAFALETIRAAHRLANRPKRVRMLYCAGGDAPLPQGFARDAGIDILRSDDLGAIVAAITPKTAGIIIAPVRLEPTLEVIPGGLLAGLREAADEYGIALVYDETHSGFCRTGMMWAHEWSGASPDLLLAGEGLAGSAPLAVVLATHKLARAAGPTPALEAEVVEQAHALLDIILAPGFEGRVQSRAWALEDRLAMLSYQHREVFTDYLGIGLIQGLVCAGDVEALAYLAATEGLLARPLGPVLGLLPSLGVSEGEIDGSATILARLAKADLTQGDAEEP